MVDPTRMAHCLLIFALASALCACGGSTLTPTDAADPALPAGSGPRLTGYSTRLPAELPLADALDEVATCPAPAAVAPEVWDELTAELSRVLQERAGDKQASLVPSGAANRIDDLAVTAEGNGDHLRWTYRNCGDYNQDGLVSVNDLTPIGMYYLAAEGDANWAAARVADGNRDGMVTVNDITPIGQNFMAAVESYNIYGRNDGERSYTRLGAVLFQDGTANAGAYAFNYLLPAGATTAYSEFMVAPCDFEGEDSPQYPLINPDAAVIEDLGLSVSVVSTDWLTLWGDSAGLYVGQVIVSGEGEGVLRRIESISPTEKGIVVQTAPATLEDLFDSAEFSFARTLSYGDLDHFDAAYDGVALEPLSTASELDGAKDPCLSLANMKVSLNSVDLGYGFSVGGAIGFALDVNVDIDVGSSWDDLGTLYGFNFEGVFNVTGEASIKWSQAVELNNSAILLGTAYFAPIPMLVGPVPVVFMPMVDIYLGFEGKLELGLEVKPTLQVVAKAGIKYTRADGWDAYSSLTPNLSLGVDDPHKPNGYLALEGKFNLFSPAPTLRIYGVAGPYLELTSPYLKFTAQYDTNPEKYSISINGGVDAKVGAKVSALGRTLVDYDAPAVIDFSTTLWQIEWQLGVDTGMIAGSVTDAETDDGIAGVAVYITDGQEFAETVYTDANGAYAKTVPVGNYSLTFSKAGYNGTTKTTVVEKDKTTQVLAALTSDAQKGSLGGVVTDAAGGAPLAGVAVSIYNGQTYNDTTDATGAYGFVSVPAGSYELNATKDGYAAYNRNVTVPADGLETHSFTMAEEGPPDEIIIRTTWNNDRFIYTIMYTPNIEGDFYLIKKTQIGTIFNPPWARFEDHCEYNGLDVTLGSTDIRVVKSYSGYYNVKILAGWDFSLAACGVEVEVLVNGNSQAVMTPPTEDCPYHSGYWAVCYINGDTGAVVPIGEYCNYETEVWP